MKNFAHLVLCTGLCLTFLACNDGTGDKAEVATAPGSQDTIYSDARGNVLTMADVNSYPVQPPPPAAMSMNVPPEAQQLLAQARQYGAAGQQEQFIKAVRQAAAAAPEWPQPWYDMAYSYLLEGESEIALRYYEQANELAPGGFFYTKAAIETLNREAEGTLPDGFFREFMAIEQIEDPAERELELNAVVELVPNYCPAWSSLAAMSPDPNQKLVAIERGLTAQCDAETFGVLVLNKAMIMREFGEKDEAVRLLSELIFNSKTTDFVRGMARSALRQQF